MDGPAHRHSNRHRNTGKAAAPAAPMAAVLELLAKLIAFNTVSHRSNLELIAFVEDYLARFGVPTWRIDFGPDKANLLARIGPDAAGGLVLSGHTDVVPTEGQSWTSDPFTLRLEHGRAFGRGTADMKGFLACALALVPALADRRLRRPVWLAFSCDEEVGCTGVRPLLRWMQDNVPPIEAVFVGEPSGMEVVSAHKGITVLRTEVTGLEAHASCTHIGVNAIHMAARLMTEIADIAQEEQERGQRLEGFTPPYTTLGVGTVRGGIAENIIPRACVFEWEIRCLPCHRPDAIIARIERLAREELLPAMRRIAPEAGIDTQVLADVPGLAPDDDSPAVRLALQFAGRNATARAAYATEAGLFARGGMPAVVCGPGHIEQAHKPDEYVEIAQLERCLAFLHRLAEYAAGE